MKEFSKKDLRTGMIVRFKNGEMAILIGADFMKKHEVIGWEYYASTLDYEEDLTDEFLCRKDIVEVYDFIVKHDFNNVLVNTNTLSELIERDFVKLIWKREREIDWSKVPEWTMVLVRNDEENEWEKAYFLRKIKGNHLFYAINCDEFNYDKIFCEGYRYIKPFDEKDIKEEWYFKEDEENANE